MKEYKIFEEGVHEYDLFVSEKNGDTTYTLCRSSNPAWTNPGEVIITATEDGNGFTFNRKIGKKIDYSVFSHLRILLGAITSIDTNIMGECTILDTEDSSSL